MNWDDDILVVDNPDIKSFENIDKMFSNYYIGHYHPLTMISYAIDYKIAGLNPKAYHLHSLLLHLISTILIFFISYALTNRYFASFLIALLFMIHPLRVESVAWIAERKDVLYAMYYLAAILSYNYYILKGKKLKYLLLTLLFFFLSLFSKMAAVSLPIVLLAFDYYHGRNFKKSIIEKLPLLLISLAAGIFSIFVLDTDGNIYDISDKYNILDRIILPFYAVVFYFVKFFYPFNLSASYFFVEKVNGFLPLEYYLSFIIVLISAYFIFRYRRKLKDLIFGLAFFIITVGLFLQILPSGRVLVADRYVYIAYFGIIYVVIRTITGLYRNTKMIGFKYVLGAILAILILVSIYGTYLRIPVWRNGNTLFTDLIEDYPKNALGYFNRGIAKYYGYTDNHKVNYSSAIKDFDEALRIDPNEKNALFNRGNSYFQIGEYEYALKDFNNVIRLDTNYAKAYCNRGLIKSLNYNDNGAIIDYNIAIQLNIEYADAYLNRGISFYNLNETVKACKDWRQAKELNQPRSIEFLTKYCN